MALPIPDSTQVYVDKDGKPTKELFNYLKTLTDTVGGGGREGAIDVKDFGATGDGSTDESTFILNAVNAAFSQRKAVYFPAGEYRVTQSAVLTQTVSESGPGLLYFGDGMDASVLFLDMGGAAPPTYFYDNVASPRMQHNCFMDIGFLGMKESNYTDWTSIPDNAGAFRMWATSATGSWEQNFSFYRCRFSFFQSGFEFIGDNEASENRWSACKITHIKNQVHRIDNVQSFNHSFFATDFEVLFGDCFLIANGGGSINTYGGSAIMMSDKAADNYFLNVQEVPAGVGGMPCSFNGMRFEFRGDYTNICNLQDIFEFRAHFNDCLMEDQGGSTKTNYVNVKAYSSILFRGCIFYDIFGGSQSYTVLGTSDQYGQAGKIIFDHCELPEGFSDRCTVNNTGRISARDCYGRNIGVISDHFAHDFDLDWIVGGTPGNYTNWPSTELASAGSRSDLALRLKVAQIKLARENWLDEQVLKMPKNAVIKNIHLRKPAGGTSFLNVTYFVGTDDKSIVHLTSNTDFLKNVHSGDTTNYFYCVGSLDNHRTLRLWANPTPDQFIHNGLCVVEYY
jgi:hypothetical protein